MHTKIMAKGYTNVVMVLNMKRFVRREDQERFENLRGTKEFADVLRTQWPAVGERQRRFLSMDTYRKRLYGTAYRADDVMSTEQVGFATGVFRNLMLERYTFPTYALDKEQIEFPEYLSTNFQFKTLFKRVWDRWHIFIRPSYTGFFVIRLTQIYRNPGRTVKALAQDIINLQESFDVPSARNWLERVRQQYGGQPETLATKERSIEALLAWLGAEQWENGELLYYPVQWKLAMEVAGYFVETIGREIPLPNGSSVRLEPPSPSISVPLHDSYVIHHFETLLAHPTLLDRSKKSDNPNVRIPVTVHDIRKSRYLRRALINLMEGAILRGPDAVQSEDAPKADTCLFPAPRWSDVDNLMQENLASWNDEFCLMKARTAILIPSGDWKNHELAVSTMPGTTLRVRYVRYWGAIERLIEFVLEIRVLAQLVESASFELLGEIVDVVQRTRGQIAQGNIRMDDELVRLTTRAAHWRRLASLAQSLSHAHLWSRAEYAIRKAEHLFNQLGVHQTLEHISRNIESINSVVDHIDEWYLADLAEKSNDQANLFSFAFAALSLILTVLMLPSFWADIFAVGQATESPSSPLIIGGWTGTLLAALLILCAIGMLVIVIKQRRYFFALLKALWDRPLHPR